MAVVNCPDCETGVMVLRRIGLRDYISWGPIADAPSDVEHAWFSNAGHQHTRPQTHDDLRRKAENIRAGGGDASHVPHDPPPGATITERVLDPICLYYHSEVSWVRAGRPTRAVVYMAHPVSGFGTFRANIRNAEAWHRYLRGLSAKEVSQLVGHPYEVRPLILAPWLAAIEPDGKFPGGREAVIADCVDTVRLFDEVWFVNRVSEGMVAEGSVAPVTRDLTHLGPRPPKVLPRSSGKTRRRR